MESFGDRRDSIDGTRDIRHFEGWRLGSIFIPGGKDISLNRSSAVYQSLWKQVGGAKTINSCAWVKLKQTRNAYSLFQIRHLPYGIGCMYNGSASHVPGVSPCWTR